MLDVEAALARAEADAGRRPGRGGRGDRGRLRRRPLRRRRARPRGRAPATRSSPLVRALRAAAGATRTPPATCTGARRARTSSTPPRCSSPARALDARPRRPRTASRAPAAALAREHREHADGRAARCCSRRCRSPSGSRRPAGSSRCSTPARRLAAVAPRASRSSSAAPPARSPRSGPRARRARARSRRELGLGEPVAALAHRARARSPSWRGARPSRRARSARSRLDVIAARADRGRGGREPAAAAGRLLDAAAQAQPGRRRARRGGRARACRRSPPRCSAAMPQEHERAAGAWHAEWETLGEALALTGGAAATVREVLERLEVHAGRMRENLDATGGLLLAERVDDGGRRARGAPRGPRTPSRPRASAWPRAGGRCATSCWPRTRWPRTSTPAALDELLDPSGYLGSAGAFVERALAAYEREDRVTVDLAHRLDGPEDAPLAGAVELAGHDDGDVGPAARPRCPRSGVVALRPRGHGGSPVPDGPYAIDDLGRDLLALLDALGIERVELLRPLARRHGRDVAGGRRRPSASTASSCAAPPRCSGRPSMWTERAATVRERGMDAIVEAGLERWFTADFRARDPDVARRIGDDAARGAARGLRGVLRGDPRPGPARAPRRDHRPDAA